VLISVLLPVKDASATVPEALAGVLAQRDAPPLEVVCVDDASVDATPALLAKPAGRTRGCASSAVKAAAWSPR